MSENVHIGWFLVSNDSKIPNLTFPIIVRLYINFVK